MACRSGVAAKAFKRAPSTGTIFIVAAAIGALATSREEAMPQSVTLNVNGKTVSIEIDDPDMPLLYALRNDLGLKGPRFGCGMGQCGACTVLIDGSSARSCSISVGALDATAEITTLEGLGTPENPHPIQAAFIEEQAVQCGYCVNGMIMEAASFLKENSKPTEEEIRAALDNNICRCGTHTRMIRAVKRASEAA